MPSSVIDRAMIERNILDRLDDLERQLREMKDYALTPQDAALNPEYPDWASISGWVITGTEFRDVNGYIVLDSSEPSITIAANGYIRSSDFITGESGFEINGGQAEFNDVVVRGTIYADVGEIGGWTIGEHSLTGGDAGLYDSGYLLLGTGDNVARIDASDAVYRLWIGNAAAANAPFSVKKDGSIYSNKGTLGNLDVLGTLQVGAVAGGNITINGTSKFIRSSDYVTGVAGWTLDHDMAEFANLNVRGTIHSSIFEYSVISATAGSLLVGKSAASVSTDFVIDNSAVPFLNTAPLIVKNPPGGGWLFASNDIVRLKAIYSGGVADVWMTVTRTGTINVYSCIVNYGTVNCTIPAGVGIADYGPANAGGLLLTADQAHAPYLDIFTHTGSPWTTLTSRARMGNLNGWGGFSTDKYGWAVGDYSAGKYAYYNPTDGLVINGNLVLGPGIGYVASGVLLYCPFDGPPPYKTDFQVNTSGHLGQVATITGGVIGRPGKFGKAVQTAEATVNLFKDSSFETNPVTTYWTTSVGGGTGTIAYSTDCALFGSASVKVVRGTANCYVYQAITTAAATHTLSVFVRRSDGGTVTSSDFQFYIDGAAVNADAIVAYQNGWYFAYKTAVETAAAHNTGIKILAGTIYLDGIQFEQKAYPTPFAYFSMPGHTGSVSTTSTRAVAVLTYPAAGNIKNGAGSLSLWYNPSPPTGSGHNPNFLDYYNSATDRYKLWYDDGNTCLAFQHIVDGATTNVVSSAVTLTSRTWIHICFTWDGTTSAIYANGTLVGSGAGAYITVPEAGTLYIGDDQNGGNSIDGDLDDFCIFDHALTADEVRQLYTNGAPITVTSSPFNLLLTGPNCGKVIGNANGLFGYDAYGTPVFGLCTGNYIPFGADELDPGDFVLGNMNVNSLLWDASEGTLTIRNYTTPRIQIAADGTLTINKSDGNPAFTFNGSAGAEFTMPLTLGTAGGIYQGTGTFNSPTTGLKIWNDGGVGRIGGYNGGVIQWYANTDGKLYAGAGAVILNSAGFEVHTTGEANIYSKWYNADITTYTSAFGFANLQKTDPAGHTYGVMNFGVRHDANNQSNIAAYFNELDIAIQKAGNWRYAVECTYDFVRTNTPFRVGIGSADPTTAIENGMLFYRTDTNKLRLRAAGAWVDLN